MIHTVLLGWAFGPPSGKDRGVPAYCASNCSVTSLGTFAVELVDDPVASFPLLPFPLLPQPAASNTAKQTPANVAGRRRFAGTPWCIDIIVVTFRLFDVAPSPVV
jgi:hypothetical protein